MQGNRAIPGRVGEPSGRRSWAAVHRELAERAAESLDAAELETLAVASYLMGDDDRCASSWESAHRAHVAAGRDADAARCSFWLAFCLMIRGQTARAGAWFARTTELVGDEPCSASGLLLIPQILQALHAGDAHRARSIAARASELAVEVGDDDLVAFARLGDGQACVALGDPSAATARFDEAMLTVTTGDVGPICRGIVYCAVILECMGMFDLRRAAEWTEVLAAWCADEPEMVPYRGQCLVHRSQLLQAGGEWDEAADAVATAQRHLAEPPHPALGLAHYQAAELHRLVGAFDEAAELYRRASAAGHAPMPGLALLELASGDADAAAVGIRRALQETVGAVQRPALLAAAVEIFREVSDLRAAREAADELTEAASANPTDVLRAMAAQASGSVALAEGDAGAALSVLRDARSMWERARMPYEAARTSVLLGLGCSAFGDRSSANLEFENAREVFESVAARPDLDRLRELRRRFEADPGAAAGVGASLSDREREVLAHVAAGETNPEIAEALSISRHTVGRHLENIFAKLGVSGRAAATAYAYEHDLL